MNIQTAVRLNKDLILKQGNASDTMRLCAFGTKSIEHVGLLIINAIITSAVIVDSNGNEIVGYKREACEKILHH